MKITRTILMVNTILILAIIINSMITAPQLQFDLTIGGLLTITASIMALGMLRTRLKVSNYPLKLEDSIKFLETPLKKHLILPVSANWKAVVPFIPMIMVAILILINPHYLFPTTGDLDFHLLRAREILENPFRGIFYDYLINYPIGRPVGHPPIFHLVLAGLWYLFGIRTAHIILSITQIILSIGVATWFANKKYGNLAGLFAGILILAAPLPDTLFVIIPATFIPIFAVLNIYFMEKSAKKATIMALLGMWTHMISIAVFPLLFLCDKKGRDHLKNWKILLPLVFSFVFWIGYWIYFTGQPGPLYAVNPSVICNKFINLSGIVVLMGLGIPGMIILYMENRRTEFKLFFVYIATVIFLQIMISDISRGLQYASLPLAILSGLTIQRMYTYTCNNYKKLPSTLFLIMLFVPAIIGASNFLISSAEVQYNWNELDIPFENKYYTLGNYIKNETSNDEVIWAENSISYKIVWMTGRPVSNGGLNWQGPVNKHQKMNIYENSTYFQIKDKNNISEKQIPFNRL